MTTRPSTALVVGASGFLGSHLAAQLRDAECELYGVDLAAPRDSQLWAGFAQGPADAVDYRALLGERPLDACFFLAGSASVAASLRQPYADWSALLPGLAYVLDYLREHQKAAHLVYYSSAAVYGEVHQLPVRESTECAPISPYGAHKHVGEQLARHYARIYGTSVSILRIFSAYGTFNRRMLFWDLCEKWANARRDGRDRIAAQGTGDETRDFIHAKDVARAARLVAERRPAGGAPVINVATGTGVRVREAAEILLGCLPGGVGVEFSGETRPSDPQHWVADVGTLAGLGFAPSRTLADGLREYADWFLSVKGTSAVSAR